MRVCADVCAFLVSCFTGNCYECEEKSLGVLLTKHYVNNLFIVFLYPAHNKFLNSYKYAIIAVAKNYWPKPK